MTVTTMSIDERENFLSQPWIAVISIPEPERGPLTVPVWYLYEPGGDLRIWTEKKQSPVVASRWTDQRLRSGHPSAL